MYNVSDAWASAMTNRLAPEGFVELSIYIPELQDTLVYTKDDLLRFTHHQTGNLVSAELPKNSIEFSIDNSTGQWNPINPEGMERYLSQRLKITLRYGFDIAGVREWIPGGVFYLSEWSVPANGIEASFVARDILEYMMNQPYTGDLSGTLYDLASRAIAEAALPEGAVVRLCEELNNYSVGAIEYNGNETVAVILQKCANAACCQMYQNRDGVLVIERTSFADSGFTVPMEFSYSFPEIEYLRPLKAVVVKYGESSSSTYTFYSSGETQTVENEFISTSSQAREIAKWVCDNIRTRQQISGDFRCDPRLDLFDVVKIENKYGTISGVVLTDIKVAFTGAFRVTYSGYISTSGVSVNIYCGEIYMGEV